MADPKGPPLPQMCILTSGRLLFQRASMAAFGAFRLSFVPRLVATALSLAGFAGYASLQLIGLRVSPQRMTAPLSAQASVRCIQGITLPASAGRRRDAR